MPTHAPTQTQFTLPPEGTHIARCYRFIHIGTVPGTYLGKPTESNKIRLSFELPDQLHVFKEENGPQPFTIDQEYTLSMGSKANLREVVHGMVGAKLTDDEAAAFDVESLVGMSCLLQIVHAKSKTSDNTYANIASIMPLMKGQLCPPAVNPPLVLNYRDRWNPETFNSLPQFIRTKMMSSHEMTDLKARLQDTNSDIPF